MWSLTCCCLFGEGERCQVDARFATPGATLTTYWEALRADDPSTVVQCFADPRQALPCPGMLWFLPPCDKLGVYSIRYTAGMEGQVIATYEVRFLPHGSTVEMHVATGSELVRVHEEWRITRPAADVGLPEWQPIPHRVDI